MDICFENSMQTIDSTEWQALWASDYPFIQHTFLSALENSQSVCAAAGWLPQHAVVREGGKMVAAMPLYAKSHSYGEYVFDWQWADAYQQYNIPYYPKLINAIPFTPATGPRMAAQSSAAEQALFAAIAEQVDAKYSSFHCLFPAANNAIAKRFTHNHPNQNSGTLNMQQRLGCQFHWFNQGYQTFDDFLAAFSSRKRKNVNKERQKIPAQDIEVTVTEGIDLSSQDWQDFYHLYQQTYLKRSGHTGYLTGEFFQQIGAHLKTQTLLVRAYQAHQLIAAALYFYDSTTLYGRYWGAIDEFDGLHFECCYYQGISIAIAKKLQRFDPGAQGEHKIQRGFTPVLTQSYHHIKHPQFRQAIATFISEEQQHIQQYCANARGYLPFREDVRLVAMENLCREHLNNDHD